MLAWYIDVTQIMQLIYFIYSCLYNGLGLLDDVRRDHTKQRSIKGPHP